MPGQTTMMDDIADDLSVWIDQTANEVALAFAPARAPFSAKITEEQKLQYYKDQLFNPDGSPNVQGRDQQQARLGADGFAQVYNAVIRRWPELKPPEPEEVEVPDEWPAAPPAAPQGPPPGPPGMMPMLPGGGLPGPGGPPGPPGPPLGPPGPPRPPMMPPGLLRR
jgi:hypothetical protein